MTFYQAYAPQIHLLLRGRQGSAFVYALFGGFV